ncbi:hypothetical protein KK083_30515 [Fulvivirgaceae bacterium PWU4]|uniref:Uncharacterized protein n=1 Tax=Chryseosolibacter histidini TaxID=2782349 RepID=A0AAP2DRK3_9BACT|nr:hypothetical protein [Chryseosolibacter histidini]MBT1701265.1 hypothetical protein [Chryseosolibacter histidini]
MISELKKAIEKAEKLSEDKQRIIADLIINEIGWDDSLKQSSDKLSMLAEEALEEYKKGKTKPLDL